MDTNAKEPFTALGFSLTSALSANSRAEAVAAIMSRNDESAKHSLSLTRRRPFAPRGSRRSLKPDG